MKKLPLALLLLVALLLIIDQKEKPTNLNWDVVYGNRNYADIDYAFRVKNYAGGSCVHASMATVLKWQHLDDLASNWLKKYSGGESSAGLIRKANQNSISVAYTLQADPSFLQWCSDTKRGAVIFYYDNHCVTFSGYDNDVALLIDNNSINKIDRLEKSTFLINWKKYGGFALTPLYAPTPPRPTL